MRILKKINNNVALAVDDAGKDLVVFGKGIGFPPCPYELSDDAAIQRVFYDIDSRLLETIATIAEDVLEASSQIVDHARATLGCKLNPNLPFTLADHLQFALDRARKNVKLDNLLAAEIGIVYPQETSLGRRGVELVAAHCGTALPESEAFAIAMHLVNAESASSDARGDMHLVMESTQIIERVIEIVSSVLLIDIDRTSYSYLRFVTHLRYLIGRLMKPSEAPSQDERVDSSLFFTFAAQYPDAVRCANNINAYFAASHGWVCGNEELLYLILHINRFVTGQ